MDLIFITRPMMVRIFFSQIFLLKFCFVFDKIICSFVYLFIFSIFSMVKFGFLGGISNSHFSDIIN